MQAWSPAAPRRFERFGPLASFCMTGWLSLFPISENETRRAPACAGGSPKPTLPGAAPGRRASFPTMGQECRKIARPPCKQQDRERYPAGPPFSQFKFNAVRSKQGRRVPWEHQKAGATPATATNFQNHQSDRKPGSLDPGLITLETRSITGACHQFHGVKGGKVKSAKVSPDCIGQPVPL